MFHNEKEYWQDYLFLNGEITFKGIFAQKKAKYIHFAYMKRYTECQVVTSIEYEIEPEDALAPMLDNRLVFAIPR